MARGNLAFTVVLLATVGGSIALMTPNTGIAGKPSAGSVPAQSLSRTDANPQPGTSEYSPTQTLEEFLYGQDMKLPTGQTAKEAIGKFIQDQSDPRFKYSVDSIIATLPDPIESGLSDKLDDQIDAIQRAAESQGYVLDRFKLPWPTPGERAAKGGEAEIDQSEDSGPETGETAQSGAKWGQRSEPGVLLFRDGHARRALVVFLVGETPTSGIHKPALRKALRQACELRNAFASAVPRGDCGDNCPPINIMGPAFSGSQDSVEFALHDWRVEGSVGDGNTSCRGVKIRMISGSATSIDQSRFQESDNIDFKATIIPDSAALLELSQWIKDRGMGTDTGEGVAILSESNTGYGGGVRAALSRTATLRLHAFAAALSLKFPIHISELQKAREATSGHTSTADSLSLALRNPNVPLAPAGRERRDVIPIYSASEVNSIELVLDQLLESIKQQRVGCVIIAASKVEDTIFLAREVRNSSPNVMVISLNASVLFLHSQVNPQVQGIFVASSYSLFSANQVWTNPFWGGQRRVQFPSDTAEGTYNATVALLGGDNNLLDYGDPFNADARIPPLWVTVIGNGGLWPLATIPIKDGNHYLYQRANWSTSQYAYYAWPGWPAAARLELLQFAMLLLTLLLGVLCAIASWKPQLLPASLDQFFAGATIDERPVERRIYQAAIVFLLIVELGVVEHYVSAHRFYGLSKATPDDAAAALLAFRASSLGSRVSPLTPVLLALGAGVALCLGALRRTRLRESRQVLTPFLDFETPSFSGIADLETRVRRALASIAFDSPLLWLATLAIVAIYASLYWLSGRWPIDGPTFAGLFFAISLLAYVGIAYAVYKLIAVWLSTRRLLRRLYWHPSRPGYEKFRGEIPAGEDGGIDLLSSAPSLTALEIGLAQVRKIIAAGTSATDSARDFAARIAAVRDSLTELLGKAERSLASTMTAYGQSRWRDEIQFKRDTETNVSEVSKVVARVYEPSWRGETPAALAAKDEPTPLGYGEIYVASRVVDWLRQVMPQLQALAFSATVAMLLMLFAISSYPFPMSDRLLWFSWAVVVVTAGAMVWMFVSANRDRVISLISGTTPGRVNWNASLLVNLVTHALLPLVVLLGAAFPERLSRLVSWLGVVFGGQG
jgi:hypothetical protein